MNEKMLLAHKFEPEKRKKFLVAWIVCFVSGILLSLLSSRLGRLSFLVSFLKNALLIGGIILFLVWLWTFMTLTVTDKRVYGKKLFGERFDIPIDSISSVSSRWFLGKLIVGSSSMKMRFLFLPKAPKFHDSVLQLLFERQGATPLQQSFENDDIPEL